MKIKHTKFRNTGLIFELLVKQIAADTLSKKDSPAISILKKHFTGRTTLAKEFKLYEFILKNRNVSESKANHIISTITDISRKFDQKALKKQKYDLISDIKANYNIDEFFGIQVRDYKPLAAMYCLLEAQNNAELVDPNFLVSNRGTILEHLCSNPISAEKVKDNVIEEFSKYDKDLKLLTFKILLEKFNDKYKDLTTEQKNVLKQFITSVNSNTRLRNFINEEQSKVVELINNSIKKVNDEVLKIKIQEITKNINPLSKTEKVDDGHLLKLMQYYDLVNELKSL